MGMNGARVIAVANEKGGVGKTATVVNLGAALSKRGHKILLVDMDPQHNTTTGLGAGVDHEAVSVYDLMNEEGDNIPARDAVLETKWERLHLIPSHIDLAGAEVELIDTEGRENRLKKVLTPIVPDYDFILIDTPPSLSLLTVNVFAFARELLIPCQTHPYAFGALADLFDTVQTIQEEMNPDLRLTGILATFFDQQTIVSRTILEKLRTMEPYNKLLLRTVIRSNTTIAASTAVCKPVVFYRTASNGAADYMALAEELETRKPM
ncbi:MAG: ParA family protein [Thermodesulfobacteriota bacterium]